MAGKCTCMCPEWKAGKPSSTCQWSHVPACVSHWHSGLRNVGVGTLSPRHHHLALLSQVASNWTSCNAPCGVGSTGYRFRTVQCVSVPSATQPSSAVALASKCNPGTKPITLDTCVGQLCPAQFWQTSGPWTPCSASCKANASDTSALGVSTRAPSVCMVVSSDSVDGSARPADDSLCKTAGLVRALACGVCVARSVARV
jgi:hypothetical protein